MLTTISKGPGIATWDDEKILVHTPAAGRSAVAVTVVPALQIMRTFKGEPRTGEGNVFVRQFADAQMSLWTGSLILQDGERVNETFYMVDEMPIEPPWKTTHTFDDPSRKFVAAFNAGWRNYYHWTVQCAFSTYLFLKSGFENPHFVFPAVGDNARRLLNLIGCDDEHCTFLHKNAIARFKQVSVSDAAYRKFVYSPSPLLADFAAMVVDRVHTLGAQGAQHIYVSRRDSKNRVMANEAELEQILEGLGFRIVQLSTMPLEEQVRLFRDARTIVAPHGAGLTNIIYCRPDTQIHELASSAYINPCFARLGQALFLDYRVHVFGADPVAPMERTWRVDIGYVKEMFG